MNMQVMNKTQRVVNLLNEMGFKIDFIEGKMISVDRGLIYLFVEKDSNEIGVSFYVNIDPAEAANIAKKLTEISSELGAEVAVYETYAFKSDKKGTVLDLIFGEEACRSVGRKPFNLAGPLSLSELEMEK